MVTLNLIDSDTIIQIMVFVLALAMSFLSLKMGGFMWFITSFAWLGLAVLVGGDWVGLVASAMALFCQALFILTVSKSGRR
jgi:hypothetical protein